MFRSLVSRLAVGIIVASIFSVPPLTLKAQQTSVDTKVSAKPKTEPDKGTIAAGDSISTADIQRAAEELAMAVQAAVKKATEDPALKVAALKVATNAVTAAQVVITQQAATLQTVLDSLAKEIAMVTEKQQQQAKQKSH